jgi:hypothetical protein
MLVTDVMKIIKLENFMSRHGYGTINDQSKKTEKLLYITTVVLSILKRKHDFAIG